MAFEVLDEHEQGEVVRKWLRANAMSIAVGISIGLLMIFGWQQWKARELRAQGEAAMQYQAYKDAIEASRDEDATAIAAALRKDHAKSAYAVFSALRNAEKAATSNDLATAATELTWARDAASDKALKALVTLRLARVTLAQGDADAAIGLLDAVPKDNYVASASELRGDALVKLGRFDEARSAYQAAADKLEAMSPAHEMLQMKLADLPAAAEKQNS